MSTILDCGHAPTAERPNVASIGTGYGTDPGTGERYCYACCDARERQSMAETDRYVAYVSGDGWRITTWTGGHLANVVQSKATAIRSSSGGTLVSYWAATPDGRLWYGRGQRGMYIKLRVVNWH